MNISKIGLPPALREHLEAMGNGMSGDILLAVRADDTQEATASGWTKKVAFWLEDSNGRVHSWFNGQASASVADTSSAGVASIDDATPAVVDGEGSVVLTGDVASWIATETATVTIDIGAIMGTDPSSVDYVCTIV